MKFFGSKQIKPQRYEFKTRYYDESLERLEHDFGHKFQEEVSSIQTLSSSNRMRRRLERSKRSKAVRKSYFSSLFLVLFLLILTGGMYYIMEFM